MTHNESNPELLAEIVEEWESRLRKGEKPDLEEYVAKYPELASDIRELLPGLAAIEHLKGDVLDYTVAPASVPTEIAESSGQLEQLGDFRILREVGRGGMGVVYEAEQVSLGRRVALKVLPRKVLVDPKQKRRFEREARSAAKLHHTNIVPVFGVGEHDGIPYYVMQFITGLPLDSVLNEVRRLNATPVPKPEGDAFAPTQTRHDVSAADVAKSLVTGHFGIIGSEPTSDALAKRGDPEQVNQSPSGSSPTVISSPNGSTPSIALPGDTNHSGRSKAKPRSYWQSIAALGAQVADALEYAHKQGILHRDIKPSNLLLDTHGTVWVTDFGLAKGDDQDNLTHTGDILGTLRYMPPEAFEGKADARGDIYSLGLTLYEMLALRPAFDERDRHLLIKNVTSAEPPRLDKLNKVIPKDLVTIIHKAMDRDPAHRYRTARELADDLLRFLADEPILARRSTPWERTLRWMRRKPAAAALVGTSAVAFVALAASITVITYNTKLRDASEQANQARSIAETSRDAEAKQRQIAEAALLEAKNQKEIADAARQEAEKQHKLAETARKEAESEREQAIYQRGLLAVHTKQWVEAAADLGAYVKSHPDDIKAWLNLGQAQAGLGERDNAVASFTKAIGLSTDNIAARLGRAEQEAARGRYNTAVQDYEHAFRINPDLSEHAAPFARALYDGVTNWRVLQPTEAATIGKGNLKILPDGSIIPLTYVSDADGYTIVAPVDAGEIGAIRLETISEPPPSTGSGPTRVAYYSGNFVLTDFSASLSIPNEAPRSVVFNRAWSSFASTYSYYSNPEAKAIGRTYWDVNSAIDQDPDSGWGVFGQYNKSNLAVFVPVKPLATTKNGKMTVRIRFPTKPQYRQNAMGRFRLSVSTKSPTPAWECLISNAAQNVSGWAKLAAARYLRGDREGATDALTRAERSSNDTMVIQLLRSIILDQSDRRGDAVAAFDSATEQLRSSSRSGYHHNYGSGDSTSRWLLVEACTRWMEREPQNLAYRRYRAESLSFLERCEDAIADFDELIKAEPTEHRNLLERGDCYLRLGKTEKAKANFAAAGKMSPEEAINWHRQRIRSFENTGFAVPIAHLDACIELEKSNTMLFDLLLKRGRARAQAGQVAEAGADFERAVQLNPSSPDALLERGAWLYQDGQREKALSDFAAARKLNPQVVVNWHNAQLSRYEYGPKPNTERALLHLNEILSAAGQPVLTQVAYLNRRIWLHRRANRYEDAIPDYTRIIELTPGEVNNYLERASCYVQLGQLDKASADFASALKFDRTTATRQIRSRLQNAEQLRNWALAIACIDGWLNSKVPPKDEVDLLRRRAHAQQELGHYKEALADCERVLTLQPDDPAAIRIQATVWMAEADELYLRGEATKATEQRRLARTTLEKLYDAHPNNAGIASELADVILAEVAGWRVLEPIEMKSAGGADLTRLPDGSIVAKGTNSPLDSYTVTALATEGNLRAFRLEAIPDSTLPRLGPGRAVNGNFVLGELRVNSKMSGGKERPIVFDRAWASFETRSPTVFFPARDAIDGKRFTVWGILPQSTQPRSIGQRHVAVFTSGEPLKDLAKGTPLNLTMEFGIPHSPDRNLGRFRLSASTSEHAMIADQISRTTGLNTWLKVAAAHALAGNHTAARDAAAKAATLPKKTKTKSVASPVNLILEAWVHGQLKTNEVAKLHDHVAVVVAKRTGRVPLPLPSLTLEVLTQASERTNDPQLLRWRGLVLEHLGVTDEAEKCFDMAIAASPGERDFYLLRGELHLRSHQWKKAAADFRKAAELKPDEHFLWFICAPLHLLAGDEDGYRAHRKAMLEHFGNTTDAMVAERTAKVCSLLPGSPSENKLLLELAKKGVAMGANIVNWARLTHALVSYRQGDAATALAYARQAREGDPNQNYIQVSTRLVEALSQHKLGKTEEAAKLLDEAEELMFLELPDFKESNPDNQFHDLVVAMLLQREAREVISPLSPPRERGPTPREMKSENTEHLGQR